MGGALLTVYSSTDVISVTVGTDSVVDPKLGIFLSQYGFANASNALNGSTIGAVSPTTLRGATITGIYEYDDDSAGTGIFQLALNGDQTALNISQAVVNGTTFFFGAPSFSGGQTRWVTGSHASGNPFGASPSNVTFS